MTTNRYFINKNANGDIVFQTTTDGSTFVDALVIDGATGTVTGSFSMTTATTQSPGDSTTAVATTAFVTAADNLKANLASPTFTGTPSLPTGTIGVTQTAANSTTALATTAFVTTADNLKANTASPSFTGTGTFTGTYTALKSAGQLLITSNANIILTGAADPSASATLNGTGTLFLTELVVGDKITINGETRTVVGIAGNTQLTVDRAFSDTASSSITRLPAAFLVKTSGGTTTGNVDNTGSWAIGALVTNNVTGARHLISGGLQSANATSTDQSGLLYITNNFYLDGSTASSSRINTTTGGSALLLDNRTSASSEAVAVLVNQPSDGLTTAGLRIATATHQGTWTLGLTTSAGSPHLIYGGLRQKQVAGAAETAAIIMEEKNTTPANPTSGSEVKMYMKADKIIFQYNDAGTVRYKYLDLTGTTVTWIHTTTAP